MLTESIVNLGKDEQWFWETELRVVWNLISESKKIKREEMKAQSLYIALSVWGKDPNEIDPPEKIDEKMAGRDMPIDENLLRGFII